MMIKKESTDDVQYNDNGFTISANHQHDNENDCDDENNKPTAADVTAATTAKKDDRTKKTSNSSRIPHKKIKVEENGYNNSSNSSSNNNNDDDVYSINHKMRDYLKNASEPGITGKGDDEDDDNDDDIDDNNDDDGDDDSFYDDWVEGNWCLLDKHDSNSNNVDVDDDNTSREIRHKITATRLRKKRRHNGMKNNESSSRKRFCDDKDVKDIYEEEHCYMEDDDDKDEEDGDGDFPLELNTALLEPAIKKSQQQTKNVHRYEQNWIGMFQKLVEYKKQFKNTMCYFHVTH
jgi:hypothetical protein